MSLPNEYFKADEKNITLLNESKYKEAIELISDIVNVYYNTLENTQFKYDDYQKRAIMLLLGMNLKSFMSAFDRTYKGYVGDGETLLKRTIESTLAQVYFSQNKDKAIKWCRNKIKLKQLEINWREVAKYLDIINKDKHFFPTNMDNFFEHYIYEIGYKNANTLAHLDYDKVHEELILFNTKNISFVLGPSTTDNLTKVCLNRIVMFSMAQLTIMHTVLNIDYSDKYKSTFDTFISFLGKDDNKQVVEAPEKP